MWTWTRIAVGVGLAGALLLAAPTEAPAGGTIGSARGAKAYGRAQADAEATARRLTETLHGVPGFDTYVRDLLDAKTEALKRLAGVK